MEETSLKIYLHDDIELICRIGYLLGSDEWYKEHAQHIWRKRGKIFYLLTGNKGQILSMCSVHNDLICDVYTPPLYRNQGYFTELISKIIHPGMKIGTKNIFVKSTVTKLGFKYYMKRGKYEYFKN